VKERFSEQRSPTDGAIATVGVETTLLAVMAGRISTISARRQNGTQKKKKKKKKELYCRHGLPYWLLTGPFLFPAEQTGPDSLDRRSFLFSSHSRGLSTLVALIAMRCLGRISAAAI
jgi:hypothetical protein